MIKMQEYKTGVFVRYVHWKLDGIQLEITKNRQGKLRAWTRTPANIADDIKELAFTSGMYRNLPIGASLLGELHVPGKPASEVKHAIATRDKSLTFSAFAIPTEDLTLPEASALCAQWGIAFAPWKRLESPIDAVWWIGQGPPAGAEGYVFKEGHIRGWYRWKPVRTMDLVVLDLKPGTGKFSGLVGALICGLPDGRIVAHVSGMDDATRVQLTQSPPIGQVVEVKYQYVGSGGRLRHPRYSRLRDDKPAHEVFVTQDRDLEQYYESHQKGS